MARAPRDSTESLADPELLAEMARGNRAALATLYTRHAPRLLALARAIVGDLGEAEDLVHDVFLEAWRTAGGYDPARGSVKIWLAVRARSRSLDRLKSKRRRRDVLSSERENQTSPQSHLSVDPADRSSLVGALSAIQESQREVLALGYFDDLSAAEIAERLNLPVGTVKSRTRAALVALRTLLGTSS
jgi:RNA polymerase sigma-70 factor (ECF subfamily)